MNIIKKFFFQIKNYFFNGNKVKQIEKKTFVDNGYNEEFKNSIKYKEKQPKTQNKIETLICPGDGLGIQTKITS